MFILCSFFFYVKKEKRIIDVLRIVISHTYPNVQFCESSWCYVITIICISHNIAAWTEATRETHMEESDGEGESETSSESHSSTFSNQSDKSNHATCLTDDGKFDL